MDEADRLEAKGLARAKIRAKRRRVYSIRRRTIRGSLALFAMLWAVVFAQLVSGNDPALSRIPRAPKRSVAAVKPKPRPEPAEEVEVPVEEPAPEAEFGEEPEVEVVPEEELPPEPEPEAVEEVEVTPEPAPEPEPVVTASS